MIRKDVRTVGQLVGGNRETVASIVQVINESIELIVGLLILDHLVGQLIVVFMDAHVSVFLELLDLEFKVLVVELLSYFNLLICQGVDC